MTPDHVDRWMRWLVDAAIRGVWLSVYFGAILAVVSIFISLAVFLAR